MIYWIAGSLLFLVLLHLGLVYWAVQQLSIQLADIQLRDYEQGELTGWVSVRVGNRLPVPWIVNHVALSVFLDNRHMADLLDDTTQQVPPSASKTYTFRFQLSPRQLRRNLWKSASQRFLRSGFRTKAFLQHFQQAEVRFDIDFRVNYFLHRRVVIERQLSDFSRDGA